MGHKNVAFADLSHMETTSGELGRLEQQSKLEVRSAIAITISLLTCLLVSAPVFALDGSLQRRAPLAYHRADWFLVISAIVFGGVLWGIHKLRLHRLHYQFEMILEARVAERTRIARDLHDTLLQRFHALLLSFETVSQLLPDSKAKTKLDSTIEDAAHAIAEGRDAVQGLRTSVVECNHLTEAIMALEKELATNAKNDLSPAFVLTVEGKPRDLHPIVRDDIYKISAEALRNAFRHAKAGRVEVEIRYDTEQFRLRVRDDGKGIDAAVLSGQNCNGHYGLHGLRERAALIGGKLVVWSEVGAGTEVELRVPSGIAFAAVRNDPQLVRNSRMAESMN